MKNDTIVYRPYRDSLFILPIMICCEIYGFILTGMLLPSNFKNAIFIFVVTIIMVLFQIYIHIISKTIICLDNDCIRVYGELWEKDRCFSWEDFSIVYYDNNFKGNHYLIFSPMELDKDERGKILWLYEWSSKYNDILVFPVSSNKHIAPLRELIYKKEENKEIVLHKTSRNNVKF